MCNRILVALKFTPAGKQALAKAVELARGCSAELIVFHALDFALQQLHPQDPKIIDLTRGAAEKMAQLVSFQGENRPKIDFICHPADPALGACKLAAAMGVQMIVLGAHKAPQKMSLGRVDYVGQTILEKAPCPVLLVPYPAE